MTNKGGEASDTTYWGYFQDSIKENQIPVLKVGPKNEVWLSELWAVTDDFESNLNLLQNHFQTKNESILRDFHKLIIQQIHLFKHKIKQYILYSEQIEGQDYSPEQI